MAVCKDCGTNVPDEIKFCTTCGKAMAREPAASAAPELVLGQPAPAQNAPVQTPPVTSAPYSPPAAAVTSGEPAKGSPYAVMSTGAYIGFSILFCLPLVGWLICVIMAFVSKNLNRRNYARALLIFMLIGLVVGVVLSVTSYFLFREAFQQLSVNGNFGDGAFLRDFITNFQ